ncbi:hypothetical protein Trco_003243 [Trichoderma cornu-damae]|uniref:Uncharacterized protein n=1 Tax=Trichoderma cornu-damae TaxID=654480 RepID=A0A9P8QWI4_9HYPO|nr:hypothetical protein Trco_003243 [Trichoderma cornu-damae]
MTEGESDKSGLGGGGGVEGLRSVVMASPPQWRFGLSPAADGLPTAGLLWDGVGTVSMLLLEKMDDAMLLLDPEPRDRSVYPDRLVLLGVRCARPGDTCWTALTVEALLLSRDVGVGVWRLADESQGDEWYEGLAGGRCSIGNGVELTFVRPRPTPHAALFLGALEQGLKLGDVVLVRLPRILQPLLVRLVPAVQLGDLLLQVVVFRPEAHQGDELLVPLVLDPGHGALAALPVVYLMDASYHGQLLVDLVGRQPGAGRGRYHPRNEVHERPRPDRFLAFVGEHELGRHQGVGGEPLEEAPELLLPDGELLAAGEIDLVGEGVVKLGEPHVVQDRRDVEVDQPQGVYVGELHAGAAVAVELRRSPLLRPGVAVDGGLVLAADVPGNAKVGQVDAVGLEQDVGRLDVQMADAVEVAVGHCAGHTADDAAEELERAPGRRVHVLGLGGGLDCAQVVELQRAEPCQDVVPVTLAVADRVQIVEQRIEIADGGGPDKQAELVGPRHVGGDQPHHVAVVELAHGQALLAQVLDLHVSLGLPAACDLVPITIPIPIAVLVPVPVQVQAQVPAPVSVSVSVPPPVPLG